MTIKIITIMMIIIIIINNLRYVLGVLVGVLHDMELDRDFVGPGESVTPARTFEEDPARDSDREGEREPLNTKGIRILSSSSPSSHVINVDFIISYNHEEPKNN